VAPERPGPRPLKSTWDVDARHLWGYVLLTEAARACLLSLTAPLHGHEVFYIVAPDTTSDSTSAELCQRFYPEGTDPRAATRTAGTVRLQQGGVPARLAPRPGGSPAGR